MKNNILFALFLCLLVSCGKGGEKPVSTVSGAGGSVQNVAVETAAESQMPDTMEFVGSVVSENRFVVTSQVMGRVVSVSVREGSRVAAGQTLLEIDATEAGSRLAGAEAGLKEAERATQEAAAAVVAARAREDHAAATAGRYRKLFDEKVVSAQEYEAVETQRKVASAEVSRLENSRLRAEAALEQARAEATAEGVRKGYRIVKAPAAGIVVEKKVEAGDMAMPGTPLLVVDNEGSYRLELQVAETEIAAIRAGSTARVLFDALAGQQFSGKVVEIVPAADPGSHTFTVKVSVSGARLHSGLYGRAVFDKGSRAVITVPASALADMGGIRGLYLVNEKSEALFRAVKVGRTHDGKAEILSGLNAGEKVVVSGVAGLVDGAKVTVSQ
ncbi:MAG: efflux RND transporter periplasmic adaptor subunit [Nitrospirota bacterium]|nr:efflux RND transporter periplasmic adaptor subunit [Nitrospirota bacterium]